MSAVALAPASADTIVGMIEAGNVAGAASLFNAASESVKQEVQSRSAVPGKDSRFKVVASAPMGARRKSRKSKKTKKAGKRKSRAHSRRR